MPRDRGAQAPRSSRVYGWIRRLYGALSLPSSLNWPLKRAFFASFGRFYRGTDLYHSFAEERRWREGGSCPVAGSSVAALPAVELPCVLIWGLCDWRRCDLRLQQLAAAFRDAGHRVVYVSADLEDAVERGLSVERFADDASLVGARLRLAGGGRVGDVLAEPNGVEALRSSIAELLRFTGGKRFLSLLQDSSWRPFAAHIPNSEVVYDCGDAPQDDSSRGFVDASLLRSADLVVSERRERVERALELGANALWLSEAVEPPLPGTVTGPPTSGDRALACRASISSALERRTQPRVSVVVVTHGNWPLSRRCLTSLARHRDVPLLDVIVVDNASQDETRAELASWAASTVRGEERRWIGNEANLGFAAACNQGLRAATGDPIVLLNNDTEVTPGWLSGLTRHLRANSDLGLLGPVTDNVDNEARVRMSFSTPEEMEREAFRIAVANVGLLRDMKSLGFFCVAIPRRVLDEVGLLDERYGLGYFEDDDYCRRVEAANYRIACAEDVFVHHHQGASFSLLGSDERQRLIAHNRRLYEERWGSWTPHRYR